MTPGRRWILIVIGLLAANMAAVIILIVTSSTHRATVVPGYHEQVRQPR